MNARNRKARDPFHHPSGNEVDLTALLDVLRDCRLKVGHPRAACGLRNPLAREAEALIEQIDAVAVLTRVPGAPAHVNPTNLGHSTSSRSSGD